MNNNRVIITGATSFLALALIECLKKTYAEVITIIRPNSSRKSLVVEKNVKVIECELANVLDNRIVEECGKADVIFHLGWSSDYDNPRYNIEGQMKNVYYLKQAILLAKMCGCHSFIGIGSQAECGVVYEKIGENTPDNPLTAYAKAKCIAYKEGILLAEQLGIRFCWPRLLSAYGPYDRPSTLISMCLRAAKDNMSLELTGCEQVWDYIYVDDVARALVAIMDKGMHGVKYTISSGNGKMLREYIEIIAKKTRYTELLTYIGKKKYVEGQPMYLVGDIDKICNDTGFRPQVVFDEGIDRLMRFSAY